MYPLDLLVQAVLPVMGVSETTLPAAGLAVKLLIVLIIDTYKQQLYHSSKNEYKSICYLSVLTAHFRHFCTLATYGTGTAYTYDPLILFLKNSTLIPSFPCVAASSSTRSKVI